jgi:hypothetical protein
VFFYPSLLSHVLLSLPHILCFARKTKERREGKKKTRDEGGIEKHGRGGRDRKTWERREG